MIDVATSLFQVVTGVFIQGVLIVTDPAAYGALGGLALLAILAYSIYDPG